ncbi:30S ribosome-binding factor RbfA [Ectothiorhodospira lacustris]|uniref:30S ribosome-binding factor RbfA n=1 Tax=Ectothiorhodospira lacustris TaxID=2899127 RepID=UPI001EE9AEB3|nr:30S ribosome-binding factor RbfA [Ectothiorhodospira lacustris]MCG5500035.1 30S ribosome-binding factor RbfA [Ectothiorhodospira lacustris]MCG5508644.1 30S ribosome-binding factor RbfA [Ectothiorhodospira lacustris]MCG5520435.1 30S ribosome-binding factor RbfA [Ectothiorhodospira lacustris]
MPKEYSRAQRVGDQIQRELAELVREELKDPRVGMLTIAGVEVSRDLAHAKVFFTVLGDDEAIKVTSEGLRKAAGFLRRELGRRMRIRSIPELHFHYDDTQREGARISALIDRAVAEDKARHRDDTDDHS